MVGSKTIRATGALPSHLAKVRNPAAGFSKRCAAPSSSRNASRWDFEIPLIAASSDCRAMVDTNGMICHLRHVPCLSCVAQPRVSTSRQIAAQSPVGQWFRPLVKTAADQTPKRSITTQLFAIQPPPLPTTNGGGRAAHLPHTPGAAVRIRQAICPAPAKGAGLVLPVCNTDAPLGRSLCDRLPGNG